MNTDKEASELKPQVIKAYKTFDKDFKCRGFQFEVGKTYTEAKGAKVCEYGFHACRNPTDVLNYYDLVNTRFAEVELSGEISENDGDTKLCGSSIYILREISANDFTIEMVRYALANASVVNSASGDSSQLSASGYSSQLSASGNDSILSSSDFGCRFNIGKNGSVAIPYKDAKDKTRFFVGYVGENIKANTWYEINTNGEAVEVLS